MVISDATVKSGYDKRHHKPTEGTVKHPVSLSSLFKTVSVHDDSIIIWQPIPIYKTPEVKSLTLDLTRSETSKIGNRSTNVTTSMEDTNINNAFRSDSGTPQPTVNDPTTKIGLTHIQSSSLLDIAKIQQSEICANEVQSDPINRWTFCQIYCGENRFSTH